MHQRAQGGQGTMQERKRSLGQTILVADDDRAIRSIIANQLISEGFFVELVDEGTKCLTRARQKTFDAFLIDIRMPGLGGLELCQKLRSMDSYRITPIIFITSVEQEGMLAEVFEAGATDFIAKPINPLVLKARLLGHMQKVDYFLEMERVRRYLNRYISPRTRSMVEIYANTEMLPAPERRDVCVMFSDIRGFTALSRETEPEILFEALNQLLAIQVDTVYEYGGYIDKFNGDGIMAIFDTGDRAVRACQCALAIMQAVHAIQNELHQPKLPIAIGMDMGPVLIGNIGSEEHLDYSVVGQAVNLASRLCSNAESMSIDVSGAVANAATSADDFEFMAPLAVKIRGIDEPVSIYKLKRHESVPASQRAQANQA